MARPGSAAAKEIASRGQRQEFDADARAKARQDSPVVICGDRYRRRRKDWNTSRRMRTIQREQEAAVARSVRVRRRIAELETEQLEAAAEGADEREAELEDKITKLIEQADESTEAAERLSYVLVASLLQAADPAADELEEDELVRRMQEGTGEHEAMDIEDVADLARELSGAVESDPQTTQESDDG